MKPLINASTGLNGLDEALNGLRIGDNVVWHPSEQLHDGADGKPGR